ncbi:TPA: TIM barrel protein [Salmonella enterica]|nr:inosose isomerase [Salmonella enterica]EAW1321992.1 inosose isomerase [Salmonella enterica subsp. diarizonae]EBZ6267873.1 inosose isomerase [Salmonella enterica subsp. enterica serovar Oranienburg]EDU3770391.1 TIM barrel protein [Salmonella enterica subsp. enterica serovar Minnesota]EEB1617011.1 TIM barrel protein [Salmonella enterica subsp. enterica serovar Enteritidis]HBL9999217.1 TIM barrel protein [Salmonella enterica subsp. enterica serovar Kodjovi]HCM8913658.1 TIM barrel protein [Sal
MTINRQRFCINRKVAINLDIEQFFRLVQHTGLNKVEIRNDMPEGRVTDGLSPEKVHKLATDYGLEITTINAVYPFNQLNARTLALTESLLQDAQGVGAKALVLCPLNNGTPVPPEQTMNAIARLTPLFKKYGIQGLIEPLGFRHSSLRSAIQTQTLIREAGSPFGVLLDSFHHYLYEKAEQDFADNIDISGIGLVHLSGVEDSRPRETLTDEDRVMLTDKDVMDNIGLVRRLEQLGYRGIYSFEPFSSTLTRWGEDEIKNQINRSIDLITAAI